jgi:hypothetical protein
MSHFFQEWDSPADLCFDWAIHELMCQLFRDGAIRRTHDEVNVLNIYNLVVEHERLVVKPLILSQHAAAKDILTLIVLFGGPYHAEPALLILLELDVDLAQRHFNNRWDELIQLVS